MAKIELHNVSKHFGENTAVKDADFTIEDGEFFILVGPSGCGKSTLLNMIMGLEDVSTGEILVDGERVDDLDPKDRNMAMVFQSYAIYPHMSVRDNMAFPLKLAKLSAKEIERRISQAAEILELGDLLERKPRALSGGQRQRVAMGRAIVREPKAFLLDEPLSNLDAKLRVQMRTEIARLQNRLETTTVYVTHDQTEAMTLGDRIAVLRQGEVLQIGTPRELYETPDTLFVAGFIGSPAMNFVPARYRDACVETPAGAMALTQDQRAALTGSDGPLVAGFRPEHLQAVEQARDNELCFEAQAEVVEWLGADLFVYFGLDFGDFETLRLPGDLDISANSDRLELVARIDPSHGIQTGDRLTLCMSPEHLQLFDADSGVRLRRG
ncbi:ABC transporter ATP-binding protein [Candidatus Tenderia electrophaga]|jgi:multiple sugar transport system ATP-binding protein|uniref:ABC transporter ATP-binding protein n=1 Tax=Candidatus Tenderia electrophaga TaxID=1748243 RepID=A0A0S2TFM7_9GAMM|nr:ABC transporter ATP-binding protein [Candidatus Tenderia electrophaga]